MRIVHSAQKTLPARLWNENIEPTSMSSSLLVRLSLLLAVACAASAQGQARPALRRDGSASIQFMVTNDMAERLRELGYSDADIGALNPQRAAAIIDNKIACPSSGLPEAWKRGASINRPKRHANPLARVVGGVARAAAGCLAVAVALHFSGLDMGEFSRVVDEVTVALLDSTRR